LKINEFEKAGVKKANAVVIFPKAAESEANAQSMVDAETIFVYKTAKYLNPAIRVITELT
jgi:hypothetical protein